MISFIKVVKIAWLGASFSLQKNIIQILMCFWNETLNLIVSSYLFRWTAASTVQFKPSGHTQIREDVRTPCQFSPLQTKQVVNSMQ